MPYSKFTMKKLRDEFNLQEKKESVFENKRVELSDWLKTALEVANDLPLHSEKSRSEAILTPILMEIKMKNREFTFFSGENLDVDIDKDLNGECDFILSKYTPSNTLISPIFALIEAKKNEIEDKSLAQCIAQMIGAFIFNQQEKNSINTIFGAVTTGEIWQFMKLEYKTNYIVTIEKKKYYIDNVEAILGVIGQIIDFYKISK